MRALALLVLCGCRSILGIDDVDVIQFPDDDASTGGEMIGGEPSQNCPGSFQALPNSGPRGHRYLAMSGQSGWKKVRDDCQAAGGFLAFPDGASAASAMQELTALVTLTGPNIWLGLSDDESGETVIFNTLNQPASNATVSLITNNTPQNDCGTGQNSEIKFEDCTNNHKFVCECVP